MIVPILRSSLVREHLEVHEALPGFGLVDKPLRQRLKCVLPNGSVITTSVHRVEVSELLLLAESSTESSNGCVDELAPSYILVIPYLGRADVDELLEVFATLIFRPDPDPVGQHLGLRDTYC